MHFKIEKKTKFFKIFFKLIKKKLWKYSKKKKIIGNWNLCLKGNEEEEEKQNKTK
ncbi:hypothetical protein DOY81_013709 [Sarcophaga bullata]|nr:hypothetical protein DOY81_013709 [Sarcophaga bullata]